jgi:UDP-glucose:(heptosyl)LPS alpha-1,3-glucosyltransferase
MTASERIGLAIQRLRPAGGLEQHAVRLAAELSRRGARVTILTTERPEVAPTAVEIEVMPARGLTNHGRLAAFAQDATRAMSGRFARTVAFHAIPGFDFVFFAAPSRARPGGLWGLLPRYRTYAALERSMFRPPGASRVLCLATPQLESLVRNGAPREQLVVLPPTLDRLRLAGLTSDRDEARRRFGAGRGPHWLWMGLHPRTKGLDRAIAALAQCPDAWLMVTGLGPATTQVARRHARRLGVDGRIGWLGFLGDADVPQAILAADVLVHPARADVTGTVILEAMANGLPVITSAVCGYSEHVEKAGAGVVLGEPFRLEALVEALTAATAEARRQWSAGAAAYACDEQLYTGIERAAALIMASE